MIIKRLLKWFSLYNIVRGSSTDNDRGGTTPRLHKGYLDDEKYLKIRNCVQEQDLYYEIEGIDMYKVDFRYIFLSKNRELQDQFSKINTEMEKILRENTIHSIVECFIENILREADKNNVYIDAFENSSARDAFVNFILRNSILNRPQHKDNFFILYKRYMLCAELCLLKYYGYENVEEWNSELPNGIESYLESFIKDKRNKYKSFYSWLSESAMESPNVENIPINYFIDMFSDKNERKVAPRSVIKTQTNHEYFFEKRKRIIPNFKKNAVCIIFHLPQKTTVENIEDSELSRNIQFSNEEESNENTQPEEFPNSKEIQSEQNNENNQKSSHDIQSNEIFTSEKRKDDQQPSRKTAHEELSNGSNMTKQEDTSKNIEESNIPEVKPADITLNRVVTASLGNIKETLPKASSNGQYNVSNRLPINEFPALNRQKRNPSVYRKPTTYITDTTDSEDSDEIRLRRRVKRYKPPHQRNITYRPKNDNSSLNKVKTGDVKIYLNNNKSKKDKKNVQNEESIESTTDDNNTKLVISKNKDTNIKISKKPAMSQKVDDSKVEIVVREKNLQKQDESTSDEEKSLSEDMRNSIDKKPQNPIESTIISCNKDTKKEENAALTSTEDSNPVVIDEPKDLYRKQENGSLLDENQEKNEINIVVLSSGENENQDCNKINMKDVSIEDNLIHLVDDNNKNDNTAVIHDNEKPPLSDEHIVTEKATGKNQNNTVIQPLSDEHIVTEKATGKNQNNTVIQPLSDEDTVTQKATGKNQNNTVIQPLSDEDTVTQKATGKNQNNTVIQPLSDEHIVTEKATGKNQNNDGYFGL
ncbi:hypothetical protein NGRA_0649, partial [Nosema granulosis]